MLPTDFLTAVYVFYATTYCHERTNKRNIKRNCLTNVCHKYITGKKHGGNQRIGVAGKRNSQLREPDGLARGGNLTYIYPSRHLTRHTVNTLGESIIIMKSRSNTIKHLRTHVNTLESTRRWKSTYKKNNVAGDGFEPRRLSVAKPHCNFRRRPFLTSKIRLNKFDNKLPPWSPSRIKRLLDNIQQNISSQRRNITTCAERR